MRKRLLATALVLAMVFWVGGCGNNMVETNREENSPSMFVRVEETNDWQIVYHGKTKVMYAVSDGKYNRGVFTPLYNADGTLQVYEGNDN